MRSPLHVREGDVTEGYRVVVLAKRVKRKNADQASEEIGRWVFGALLSRMPTPWPTSTQLSLLPL